MYIRFQFIHCACQSTNWAGLYIQITQLILVYILVLFIVPVYKLEAQFINYYQKCQFVNWQYQFINWCSSNFGTNIYIYIYICVCVQKIIINMHSYVNNSNKLINHYLLVSPHTSCVNTQTHIWLIFEFILPLFCSHFSLCIGI